MSAPEPARPVQSMAPPAASRPRRRRRASPVPQPPLVQEWLEALRARELAERTLRSYADDLTQFAAYLGEPLERATVEDIRGFAEAMSHEAKEPRTRQRRLVALRQFYAWLVERGHLPTSPADRVHLPKLVRAQRIPDMLADADVRKLRRALANAAAEARTRLALARARRDRALIELGLASLRIGEVVGVRLDGLARLTTHHQIKIIGKGGAEYLQPITDEAVEALTAWMALRPRCRSRYVFIPLPPRGDRGLHWVHVERLVRAYYDRAHIKHDEIQRPFHALRHTAGTKLGDAGFDLQDIQKVLRHADPRTTAIYVHVSGKRLREVVRKGLRFGDGTT